jgi:hypothetical protein
MPVLDYTDLVTTTSEYLGRADIANIIDRFVGFAEMDIERVIEFSDQQKDATLALVAGRATLPTDFYRFRTVQTVDVPSKHLSRISAHLDQSPDYCSAQGYYTDANEIVVMPKTTESVVVKYYAKIPRLSAAFPTNWLLARASDVMLSGTIYHAMLWANDPRMDNAKANFFERLNIIRRDEMHRRYTNAVISTEGGLP